MDTVCGLDEAGRGALAGPIVGAAVVLPCPLAAISLKAGIRARDSKLMTAGQRTILDSVIRSMAVCVETESIDVPDIDAYGISWANREIFRRLILRVDCPEYVVDGNLKLGDIPGRAGRYRSVVDADATFDATIAAGIVAKTARDRIMDLLHETYPQYGWNTNRGYGTKVHIRTIAALQATPHHRILFTATALSRK